MHGVITVSHDSSGCWVLVPWCNDKVAVCVQKQLLTLCLGQHADVLQCCCVCVCSRLAGCAARGLGLSMRCGSSVGPDVVGVWGE
jgi:hypothetical protein